MFDLVAQEITKVLAPWLWEEFNEGSKRQIEFFSSKRELSSWQLEELVVDVESLVTYSVRSIRSTHNVVPSERHQDFDFEIDAVNNCIRDLRTFLHWSKRPFDYELHDELEKLRKALGVLLREVSLPDQLQLDMRASKYKAKLKPFFLERRAKGSNGQFISKTLDEQTWLDLRKSGLTSSDAGQLIRLNGERRVGWRALFETKVPGFEPDFFDSYSLGIEREPKVAEWVIEQFPDEGFFHNDFTYLSVEDERLMSTPDMVGDFAVCEIKVSSADLKTNVQRYRDQIQWHMMVLDAPRCLFVVENRYDQSKSYEWVDVDNKRADSLRGAAEEWLEEFAEWQEDGDVF